MAYGVEENEALTAPPLPPMPSQCVTSVPTTPVEPVYSAEPSGLGEVPLILLPLDDVPVPMAWLTPPPATRPPEQSAWVEISAKAAAGPEVAPGVLTVTLTVLAYAVAGMARASAAPMTSAFPVARRSRSPLFMESPLWNARHGSACAEAPCPRRCRARSVRAGEPVCRPAGKGPGVVEPETERPVRRPHPHCACGLSQVSKAASTAQTDTPG